jgi:hypothetical protein
MNYETIEVSTQGPEGQQVGLIRLNRPKQLNALNDQLMDEMGAALLAFAIPGTVLGVSYILAFNVPPVELTGTEFDLLHLLAREPGKVFSRDDILNHLRGHEAELFTRAVDIVVSRLRKKLEPLDAIKTLRNAGYAFAGARV